MRTFKVTCGPHHDADATMAATEPCWKQLLHFISCKTYELQASHLWPRLRSFKMNLFTR